MISNLDDCFDKNPVYTPKPYVVKHKYRIQYLLTCNIPKFVRRQAEAILYCLEDDKIKEIVGFERFLYILSKWEDLYT